MTRLAISYPIPLPGAAAQGTASADRYVCSLVAAAAAHRNGKLLGGVARGLSLLETERMFQRAAEAEGVPVERVSNWARCVQDPKAWSVCRSGLSTEVDGLALDDYQLDAIEGMTWAGGVLALGCGLGKTLTAVAAAATAFHNRPTRCWIVCPLNAMGAWKRFVRALKGVFADVQILSMDSIFKIADGLDDQGGVIIFDEVHLLGSMNARRTKAAHKLRLKFDAGLCLTGTLLHAGIEKALSILDLAVPGAALFSSRWKAGEHFKCLVRKRLGARTVTELEKPTGAKRQEFLDYLSRFVVSMTKDTPAVASAVTIPQQMLQTTEIGACDVPLEQLAADYVLQEMESRPGEIPTAAETAHALCRQGVEEKLDWLLGEMADNTEPVVVFAQYHETLDAAEARLAEEKIPYVRVDGSTAPKDRQEAQRKFQAGEVRVFLGQITAAGISMDLFRARISVTLDVNWRAADYAQALARTCRRGQEYLCHHFDLVTNVLQKRVVERLRAGADFDASLEAYQRLKGALTCAASPSKSDSPGASAV